MKCSFISMATLVFLFASTQVPPASAQSECNSRQQALDRRMEDFDKRSRCTQGPSMTIGGPEWQACEREKQAILIEKAQLEKGCAILPFVDPDDPRCPLLCAPGQRYSDRARKCCPEGNQVYCLSGFPECAPIAGRCSGGVGIPSCPGQRNCRRGC
jgi:hypothetical protein